MRQFPVLEAPSTGDFAALTTLLARVLDVPLVQVWLKDERGAWRVFDFGLPLAELPNGSVFQQALSNDLAPLFVCDTHEDPRFSADPAVKGSPNVRFLGEVPLHSTDGQLRGKLRVMDRRPRRSSPQQLELLTLLGRQAVELLEFGLGGARQRPDLVEFVENLDIPIRWLANDGVLLWANRAELRLLGYSRDEYLQRSLLDFCVDAAEGAAILQRLQNGEALRGQRLRLRARDGSIKILISDASPYGGNGHSPTTRWVSHDVTEREARDREIALHRERELQEKEMALHILQSLLREGCLDSPEIRYVTTALADFNGDLVLAERLPSGGLRLMLGDFVGHGLPAAIGGLPLAAAFYATTKKGIALDEVIRTMNAALRNRLPRGYFCAAILLELNRGQLVCWNGGMPPVLVRRGDKGVVRHLVSHNLPLGVLASEELQLTLLTEEVVEGDYIWCFSDGLIETRDAALQLFGLDGVERTLARTPNAQAFNALLEAVTAFRADSLHADDLSLVELSVRPTRAAT